MCSNARAQVDSPALDTNQRAGSLTSTSGTKLKVVNSAAAIPQAATAPKRAKDSRPLL